MFGHTDSNAAGISLKSDSFVKEQELVDQLYEEANELEKKRDIKPKPSTPINMTEV